MHGTDDIFHVDVLHDLESRQIMLSTPGSSLPLETKDAHVSPVEKVSTEMV